MITKISSLISVNNDSSLSYKYCGWLQNPAPVDRWKTSHSLEGWKTIPNWWFIGFRNHPQYHQQIQVTIVGIDQPPRRQMLKPQGHLQRPPLHGRGGNAHGRVRDVRQGTEAKGGAQTHLRWVCWPKRWGLGMVTEVYICTHTHIYIFT